MLDIAVFTALGWERRAVVGALGTTEDAGPWRWRARLGDGTSCLVVQTGIGPEHARAAVAATQPARAFIGCGCAAALVDGLGPGDLVVAESVIALDVNARVTERLPASAQPVIAWAEARGTALRVGPIASVPAVLETARAKCDAGACGALVAEMESAAIATEARARGIPFVGIRVVLDVRGQAVPALDALDAETGELRTGRAIAQLALRPRLWTAAGRLARQTRIADARLRAFLGALFAAGMPALVGDRPRLSAIG